MKRLKCRSHLAERAGQPTSLGSIQNLVSMSSHSEWQPCGRRFPGFFIFYSQGDPAHLCRIYLGAALFSRLFKHLSMRRQQTHISTNTCQIHLDVYGVGKKKNKNPKHRRQRRKRVGRRAAVNNARGCK